TTWSSSTKPLDKPTDMVGWYLPPKSFSDSKSEHESVVTEKIGQADDQEDIILERIQQDELDEADSLKNEHCDDIAIDEVDSEITNHSTLPEDLPLKSDEEQNMEEECADDAENSDEDSGHSDDGDNDDDNDNDDDDDDDDDEGWITPRNIKRITKHFSGNNESSQGAKVGCMTTDFAMQNVLIQMGIPVLSLNGMFIKRTKTYVLKCSGCFKVTAIMTKQFCPHCGNKTLMKVTVTLDDNGKQHFHMSRRKIENKRGLKYSLPMPQGGKHATNPHLVEDQPFPKNRPSRKALKKTNAFDPNYAASVSPFATHDVTSRAAQLGVNRFGSHSGKKRNPNENRSRRK
ncbi:RNA-binding protein NOB1-like, partial [Saccoglossus kowalevskii]|uniref:RNA-binding protein NOB1-like n=1 Tax=Saccoglossus kowalevskii TaxID=10224 RepID=A0ABM0H0R0_SACKO